MQLISKFISYEDLSIEQKRSWDTMEFGSDNIFALYSSSKWNDTVSNIDNKKITLFLLINEKNEIVCGILVVKIKDINDVDSHYNIAKILSGENLLYDSTKRVVKRKNYNFLLPSLSSFFFSASISDFRIKKGYCDKKKIRILDYLLKELIKLAKESYFSSISFLHVDESNKILDYVLTSNNFIKNVDGPIYFMNVDESSYLERLKRLPAKTRYNIKREIRLFQSQKDIKFLIKKDDTILNSHCKMAKLNAIKYGWNDFNIDFFKKRIKYMMDSFKDSYYFFYLLHNNKVIGTTFAIEYNKVLYVDSTGVLGEEQYRKYGLYFQLNYYHIYDFCVNNGIKKINYAEKCSSSKLSRGCNSQVLYNYVYLENSHSSNIIENIYVEEMKSVKDLENKYN